MMMKSSLFPRLVADIGGTNARFALVPDDGMPPQAVAAYRCAEFATLWDTIKHYLDTIAKRAPQACAIGIATAITGDRVQMTNHPWSFSIRELQHRLGVERLLVLNDFSALALSLPALPRSELAQVGGGAAVAGAPLALIGPGTGLGVSGLLRTPGGDVPIVGEGGHASLASSDPEEAAVIEWMGRRFGHVSAERALSGPGLQNLHEGLTALAGAPSEGRSAAQIVEAALAGTDARCVRALEMFCGLLGDVAGNLALTLGARGGVYIGGGIVPRLGERFERSRFRERFEAKGRLRDYLSAVPTCVVRAETSPALIGASRALDVMG
jgi:glucokinase